MEERRQTPRFRPIPRPARALAVVFFAALGCAATGGCGRGGPGNADYALKREDIDSIHPDLRAAYRLLLRAEEGTASQAAGAIGLRAMNRKLVAGDYRLVPYLALASRDDQPLLRSASLAALGYFLHDFFRPDSRLGAEDRRLVEPAVEAGVGAVLLALADTDPAVRRQAAQGLRSIRRPAAVGAAIRCLQDPSPLVRHEAALALGLLGDLDVEGKAPEALRPLLEDPDPLVRRTAAAALKQGSAPAPESTGPADTATQDPADAGTPAPQPAGAATPGAVPEPTGAPTPAEAPALQPVTPEPAGAAAPAPG